MKSFALGVFFAFCIIGCSKPQNDSFLKGGNEVGNGGKVMVCENANVKTFEILDYFEARSLSGLTLTAHQSADPMVIVNSILSMLEKFDAARAIKYKHWAETFLSESSFLKQADLWQIGDTGPVLSINGCLLKQAVVQRKPEFTLQKRYLFNNEIWDALDSQNRAGLILHEIVYRDAIERGHIISAATRYFTGLIGSTAFSNLSLKEYENTLFETKLLGYYNFEAYQNHTMAYIPGLKLSFNEALNFCKKYKMGARLPISYSIYSILAPNSAIAEQFVRESEPVEVWSYDNSLQPIVYKISRTIQPLDEPGDLEVPREFVCEIF